MLRAAAGLFFVAATLTVFAACSDDPVPRPCSNIPAGGCPLSRGVACEDPACEAVYACRPGDVWELQEYCPPRERDDRSDASVQTDASDCMLGLAMSCGADCCGCEDLYVCEDRGWTLWGSCGDGGIVPGR